MDEAESSEAASQATRGLLLPHDALGPQHREGSVPVVPRAVRQGVTQSARRAHIAAPPLRADDEQDPRPS
jgi:hypothetical protein